MSQVNALCHFLLDTGFLRAQFSQSLSLIMLLNINTKTGLADKCRTEKLNFFGLDERGLQDILFKTLDRLFPEKIKKYLFENGLVRG